MKRKRRRKKKQFITTCRAPVGCMPLSSETNEMCYSVIGESETNHISKHFGSIEWKQRAEKKKKKH